MRKTLEILREAIVVSALPTFLILCASPRRYIIVPSFIVLTAITLLVVKSVLKGRPKDTTSIGRESGSPSESRVDSSLTEDHQRSIEQRSLSNVRNLLDQLEARRRAEMNLPTFGAVLVASFAIFGIWSLAAFSSVSRDREVCLADIEGTWKQLRNQYPARSDREIDKLLDLEVERACGPK